MKKRLGTLTTKMIAAMSVLSALGIILGKLLAFNITEFMRFSLENLSIILSGIAFGPICGLLVGAVQDLVGSVMVGYAINPIITLGSALIGFISGLVFRYTRKLSLIPRTAAAVASAHLIGSVFIKSAGLAVFYSLPYGVTVMWRLLNYTIVGVIECITLILLLKSKQLLSQIKKLHPESELNTIKPEHMINEKMTYTEALEYIHGVSWTFCKPGLERTEELCKRLGDPQKKLRFIHVAGTNGKGSFSSMTASVLCECGFKVGLYTSPYILRFNERMKINGEDIPDEKLAEITAAVKPIADSMSDKPTEFELITAIAFLYFAEEKVDFVVLECGMGGRLDSTNVIEAPELAVITGIALDHTAFLGDTVEKIALEKGGIIKHNCPVLLGGENKAVAEIIRKIADSRSAELYLPDYKEINIKKFDFEGTLFDYKEHKDVFIKLLGVYQPRNAALVLSALDILKTKYPEITDAKILSGLAKSAWPARFEMLINDPLVIFDGAHNPEGITSAAEGIKRYFGDKRVAVVSGVLEDKDYRFIAGELSEISEHIFTMTPPSPRALPAEKYAEVIRSLGIGATAHESISSAVKAAMNFAREKDIAVVCLGSLYTYGDVKSAIDASK